MKYPRSQSYSYNSFGLNFSEKKTQQFDAVEKLNKKKKL